MKPLPEITIPPGQIDDILKAYRYPCRFILEKGEYTTRGIWNFSTNFDCCMLPPQSELIGAGSNLTSLKLANTITTYGNGQTYPQYHVLTGGNRTLGSKVNPSTYMKVSGITIECNINMPVIGLYLWTSNAIVDDVVVKDVWGDWKTMWEGFGILINNCGNINTYDGGHSITNCKVYVKSGAYATGLYVGCVKRDIPLEQSLVSNCKVVCYDGNVLAHAAYGINSHLIINNCEGYGFDHAIFNDTSDSYDTKIINSYFRKIGYAFLALKANDSGWNRDNIVADNCLIEFDGVKSDHMALLVCDDQSQTKDKANIKNISITNSIIRNKTTKTFYLGSINGKKFSNISLTNNTLPVNNSGMVVASPASQSMWIDKNNLGLN